MKMESVGNVEILYVDQDIHIKKIEEFKNVIETLIQKEAPYFILNMREVQYINSAGLGIIANAVMTCRRNNKNLVIAEISAPVKEIFDLVKFDKFIKLVQSNEEAIRYYTLMNN